MRFMNVLIVGDDIKSVNILAYILKQEGYDVSNTVSNPINRSPSEPIWADTLNDLLILDEAMLNKSLLERIEAIRNSSSVAIMLLASLATEAEIVKAYEAGIDDFISKPFGYHLLLAHVNAQLRRARVIPSTLVPDLNDSHLSIDPERHTVTLSNKQVRQLTNLEFRLLYCMVVNRGHVLTTETIIEKVWGYSGEGDRNLLKSLISRLRSKIEPSPREPQLITTVPGVGYTFNPTHAPSQM